ncbi:aminoacyltransferase [Weissella viridescens]|uniref:Aminoacyltransferase FemA n=1 Tax=Weissella viridescens TaxID=1629 RepID=A0A3P2RDF6_WEIVI|nr:peptidoglycan bridge formation glycyltransferase FemA/FemB family protein [Weissella viridescens]RRG18789.1 aminoacyltransferase [Weissella viridescens]
MKFVDLSTRLDDWNAFVDQNVEASFTQSEQQYELLKHRTHNPMILGLVDDDNNILIGSLLTLQHVKLGNKYNLEYGPVVNDWHNDTLIDTFFTELQNYAKQHNIMFITVSPNTVYQTFTDDGTPITDPDETVMNKMATLGYTHEPFRYGMTDTQAVPWQYVKDLTGMSTEDIHKSYHKIVKQALKKQANGVHVRELSRDELPLFKQILDDTSIRRNFHTKDLDYFQTTYDDFGERVKFVVAELHFSEYIAAIDEKLAELNRKIAELEEKLANGGNAGRINKQLPDLNKQRDNQTKRRTEITALQAEKQGDVLVLAGAQFMITPQEVDYLFSGSYEEYGEFYGPHQIQDYMIQMTHDLGINRYNFLGIDGRFDGSDGVMNFKTKFSGHVEQKVGTFDRPVQGLKYKLYRLAKNLKGSD